MNTPESNAPESTAKPVVNIGVPETCEQCGDPLPATTQPAIPAKYPKPPLSDYAMIEINFSYHRPNNSQTVRYETLRDDAKKLAYLIHDLCPASRERSLAMTHLETVVMWANAAIARNG